jgi:predicted nucleic acid-binding protein
LRLVIDSSVALKWFVSEPNRELAAELLDGDDVLIAPDLILVEVSNAMWRKARKGEVTALQVVEAIHEIGSITALHRVTPALTDAAFQIAEKIGHSIYDCIFLACAIETGAELVTADGKFYEKAIQCSYATNIRRLASV